MANKQTEFENNNSSFPADDNWLNMVNTELKNVCIGTGQTIDASEDQNIKGMAIIASQASLYCVDTGTANAYVLNPVSPLQAPPVIRTGMSIKFATGNANTGSSNINAYGFGNILAKNQDGTNLSAGDIPANVMVEMYYNGTNWILNKGTKATTTAQGIVYLNNPITIANNNGTGGGNANTDIDFTAGNFSFSDGSGQAIAPALTKRLQSSGSWSAGAGGNLLTTGARVNSSTYHLYAIYNPTTLATDYMALLGVDGTTPDPTAVLPSGYTKASKNPICSVLTDASGNIVPASYKFKNDGNYVCKYNTSIYSIPWGLNTVVSSLQSISVPSGLQVNAYTTLVLDISSVSTGNYSVITVQDFNKNSVTDYALAVVKIPSFTNTAYAKPAPVLSNKSRQIWFAAVGSTNLSSRSLAIDGYETLY